MHRSSVRVPLLWMAPPKPGSPAGSLTAHEPAPPEARLPTKVHERKSIWPASLRMAPPDGTSSGLPAARGVCAVFHAKEQLLAFTVPPRLKIAPPLAWEFR